MTTTSPNLRRTLRARRRALSAAERALADTAIIQHLRASPLFLRSRRLAGYVAADGEPDIGDLMRETERLRKQWHLPVIGLPYVNRLWFAPCDSGSTMLINRYGIPEPDVSPGDAVAPWALDLVLTPLVGFDAAGNRLGMGKGFYDRSFAFLRQRQHWRKPRLIGVAYQCQRVDALPFQPWDVPLAGVVTESGLQLFSPRD